MPSRGQGLARPDVARTTASRSGRGAGGGVGGAHQSRPSRGVSRARGGLRAGRQGPGRKSGEAHPGPWQAPGVPLGSHSAALLRGDRPSAARPSPHLGGAAGMCRGRSGRFYSLRGAELRPPFPFSSGRFGGGGCGGCATRSPRSLRRRRPRAPLARPRAAPRPQRQHGRRPGRGLGGGGPAARGGRLLLPLQADAGAAARRPGAAAASLPVRR